MSQGLRTLAAGMFAVVLTVFPAVLLGGIGAYLGFEFGTFLPAAIVVGVLLVAWTLRHREATSLGNLDPPTR